MTVAVDSVMDWSMPSIAGVAPCGMVDVITALASSESPEARYSSVLEPSVTAVKRPVSELCWLG